MDTLMGLTLYLVGIGRKIFLARHLTPSSHYFPVHLLQGLIHFSSICGKQNLLEHKVTDENMKTSSYPAQYSVSHRGSHTRGG